MAGTSLQHLPVDGEHSIEYWYPLALLSA